MDPRGGYRRDERLHPQPAAVHAGALCEAGTELRGYRPVSNEVGESVSSEVLQAVDEIVTVLDELIPGLA